MMPRPPLVIINGSAASGRCATKATPYLEQLKGIFPNLEIAWTEAPGDATNLARQALENGCSAFIAIGGDGTVFEVANGLAPANSQQLQPTLSIIPLGTGNSLALDLNINNASQAVDAIRAGTTRAMDVVEVKHSQGTLYFLNILSLGFAANAGRIANDRFKSLGALGYVAGVLGSLIDYKHYPMQFSLANDSDSSSYSMVAFSNSRFTGGNMLMAPAASIFDGKMDCIRVDAINRRTLLKTFPRIFNGTHIQASFVHCDQTQAVYFTDNINHSCMIDGEILTLTLQSLSVLPSQLNVTIAND